MFDNLKGMASMAGLMKDLPRIKAKFEEVKERLGDISVEAETGGGAVRVTADGHMKVRSVHVDQSMMSALVDTQNESDRSMAEDLIVGAVNAALTKAREAAEREVRVAASELGVPIPPGGLGGLLPGGV
jgi:DNA-binding YbaB/EbfC family protein